jgi:hypothetical protein
MATWSAWVKWNGSMERTLSDGQHTAAGEASVADAKKKALKTGAPGILLVDQLADHQMLGRVWVLGPAELHQHFGSKTPAKKAIDADHEHFISKLERGQAVAITAFLKGLPVAVLFGGQTER